MEKYEKRGWLITENNKPILNKFVSHLREIYEDYAVEDTIRERLSKVNLDYTVLYDFLYTHPNHDKYEYLEFEEIVKMARFFNCDINEFISYNCFVYEYKFGEEEGILVVNSQSIGKYWEERVMRYYSERGYFVYKIPTMNDGTAFDIIAVHKGAALFIECKHIEEEKLFYKKSGLYKKRDELDHLVNTCGTNVYLYVSSEKTGTWWTTWSKAKPIFEAKGYLTLEDCFKCDIENK